MTFTLLFGGGKGYIISHLVDRILSEMFLSDNVPKHEINLSRAQNILKVSAQLFQIYENFSETSV